MVNVDNQHDNFIHINSTYSWESILRRSAYRGVKINRIAEGCKAGYECRFEDRRVIKMISETGQSIMVNLDEIHKSRDRWTLSRLVHNFRMLFSSSQYAQDFNNRIRKLAEVLTTQCQNQNFSTRCQENIGNLSILPADIHDKIIFSLRKSTSKEILSCIKLMKMFWKAPLGGESVHGTIDARKFANWINHNSSFDESICSTQDHFTLLPYLHSLYLNASGFNFDHLGHILKCKNLKFLTLCVDNELLDHHFLYITRLSSLVYLDIRKCPNISDEGFKLISNLKNLSALDIFDSKISEVGFHSLAKLSNLTYLKLDQCPNISDEDIKPISKLKKLNSLVIIDCKISGFGLRYIRKLSNLIHIYLDSSHLKNDESLSYLANLKELETLTLGSAHFNREGFQHLSNLRSLKSITLYHGSFSDEDCEFLGKITNLVNIHIWNDNITGDGLKYFEKLDNLEHLNLGGCRNIIDDNIHHIARIKNLIFLDVYGCRLLTKNNLNKLPGHINWNAWGGWGRFFGHTRECRVSLLSVKLNLARQAQRAIQTK